MSTTRQCKLHKNVAHGFCLHHAIYCCPTCHQKTYPDCSVSDIDYAARHLQKEHETLAGKIHDALQSCKTTNTTLRNQFDNTQHQCDEAIDLVNTFCDQLQSTIENFRQQGVETIRTLNSNRIDTTKEQLQRCKEMEHFLVDLNKTDSVEDTTGAADTRHPYRETYDNQVDLVTLNVQVMEIRDGLAQVQPGDCVRYEDNFSIFIQDIDPGIHRHLATQLNSLCDSIGKSPEGCSKTSNPNRPISPAQASSNVKVDQDTAIHSLCSGTRDTRDNQAPDSFREVTRISHKGSEQVVRFARSSSALYILVASAGPCTISKYNEHGKVLVTEKTKTTIWDMSVRGEEVFATANDRTIKVYSLKDLHIMRQFPTDECCCGILCTDHDLVVTFPFGDNKRVCRMSDFGHITYKSSCKFTLPVSLTMSSDGDRILVSDCDSDRILILSADLKLITKVTNRAVKGPNGLCVVGESVFVAYRNSDSVVELDSHGRYKRTVVDQGNGIVTPYALSYDGQSRKLAVSSDDKSQKIRVFVGDS